MIRFICLLFLISPVLRSRQILAQPHMHSTDLTPFHQDSPLLDWLQDLDSPLLLLDQGPGPRLTHYLLVQSLEALGIDDANDFHLQAQNINKPGMARYQITWRDLAILGATFQILWRDDRILQVSINHPESLKELTSNPAHYQLLPEANDMLWYPQMGGWVLARQVEQNSPMTGLPERLHVDGDGRELNKEVLVFHFATKAQVYLDNRPLTEPADTVLTLLQSPDLLDGLGFQVFGSSKAEARAQPGEEGYRFDPQIQSPLFDQVQAYYNASLALSFFADLGFTTPPKALEIYTHTPLLNNARYVPAVADGTAKVEIGYADDTNMRNLNKDRDVMAHELAHHIIYQTVKSTQGEAGILHEGYADYFAYALSGDPFLAESTPIDRPWLRRALVNGHFSQAYNTTSVHAIGSIWAGYLWRLRQAGEGSLFDQVVLQSLTYLPAYATIQQALLGLVWADASLSPNPSDPYGRGQHFCQIAEEAIEMGFERQLAGWDLNACGPKLGAALEPVAVPEKTDQKMAACGVVAGSPGKDAKGGGPWVWFLLFIPALWVVISGLGKRHRSGL